MNPHAALAYQAEACRDLGSPFLGRFFDLAQKRLTRDTLPGRIVLDWPGDASPRADSVPLRLSGALHALVLGDAAPELAAVFPPNDVDDDALWAAVAAALDEHGQSIAEALKSPPQTNEIRRSAAILPALHLIADETGLPLVLSELGASGGLNLLCDRFHLLAGSTAYGPGDSTVRLQTEWSGPAPKRVALEIAERAGVDLLPFDLAEPGDRLRLMAYVWPDQRERLANMQAALGIAAQSPPPVAKGDAADWLEARLDAPRPGQVHVVYYTIAFQYFPAAAQARIDAALALHGSRATEDAPLARLSMENDGGNGAGLNLTMWPGGHQRAIGRVDFHGRWVKWAG